MSLASLLFAAIAAVTPTCAPGQVTGCEYVSGTQVIASVPTAQGIDYFELDNGQLVDLESYGPAARVR